VFKRIYLIIVGLLILTGILFGGTTGKIVGQAVDATNGEPLAGVNVEIPAIQMGAATDLEGYFIITNVPPGKYVIKLSYIGYSTTEVINVAVTVDQTTTIQVEMQQETLEIAETITVVAQRPVIQKDVTSKRSVVEGNMITDILPVSTITDVLSIQAGVISDEDGNVHIRGGRTGEVAYLIDGTYVRNPFDNTLGGRVDVEAIQEMEVISGTFNAEYGNALSGVVNVVTKEGAPEYHFKLQYESPMLNESPYHKSDWLLDEENVKNLPAEQQLKYLDAVRTENGESGYRHISLLDNKYSSYKGINMLGRFNGALSGPIPFIEDIQFFVSGTFHNEDSYLPYGFTMDRVLSSKFTYRISPSFRLQFNADWSRRYFQDYNHQYKYWQFFDEEGTGSYPLRRDDRNRLSLKFTHTLSSQTFYTLSLSQIYNYEERKIEDRLVVTKPNTGELISTEYLTRGYYEGTEGNFRTGDDRYWYETESKTYDIDFDFVSQVDRFNLIKAGVEYRRHDMFRHRVGMPPRSSIQYFTREPFEFAAYIQDKIELDFLIINLGLRFDYFKAADVYYPDPANILETVTDDQGQTFITTVEQQDVPPESKFSPRVGLAYPVTERTVFHFAYGHFFQIPRLYDLYRNDELEDILVNDALVGNPGLKPEETVAFEAGIKQQLGLDYALDITAYNKDISNLISSFYYFSGRDYTIFINADYGRVQGIDVTLNKRYSSYFSGAINYTYMVAMGNESDPTEGYSSYREESAHLKPNRNFYLDFDRRHSFNLNVNFMFPKEFGPLFLGFYPFEYFSANFIFAAASGLPYTPSSRDPDATIEPEKNSARKPWVNQLNFRIGRDFYWGNVMFKPYVFVENFFDHINVLRVWTRTGQAWDQGPTSNYPKDRQANPENVDVRRTVRVGLIIRL
jgi:outer membrane receptor protein involved in Fe transport